MREPSAHAAYLECVFLLSDLFVSDSRRRKMCGAERRCRTVVGGDAVVVDHAAGVQGVAGLLAGAAAVEDSAVLPVPQHRRDFRREAGGVPETKAKPVSVTSVQAIIQLKNKQEIWYPIYFCAQRAMLSSG